MSANNNCPRRSSRLFGDFIKTHANANPGDMVEWIKGKLAEVDNADPKPKTTFGICQNKEDIAIEIYATIVQQERVNRDNNNRIFEKPRFMATLIAKLQEFIDQQGDKWAQVWAYQMMNELNEIRRTRFPFPMCPCGKGCDQMMVIGVYMV
jgi:hypothetical protein